MKCKLLLSTILVSSSFFANAQYEGQTYAITGGTGDYTWSNIRQVNIATGKVTNTILSNGQNQTPGDLIAATAFDVQSNKLFYATMHTGQLRWVDMNSKTVSIEQQEFVSSPDVTDESINVTRMCFGPDGYGYALTNDGSHLYRFTTDNKPVVTDLGNLVDAESNTGMSIHNKCSSWGGDMVADVYGKLYVITAGHNVFIVDINTRIATFIGTITGLPANYSTNGAAVDDNGDIVVNGSIGTVGYYKVKLADLSSTLIEGSDKNYSISDLANGNLLLQNQVNTSAFNKKVIEANGHVYPNPTTNSVFNVSFDGLQFGNYLINVTDLSGKSIYTKSVTVGIAGQVETIAITPKLAVGMYLIKVSNADNQTSFTEKIVIN